MTSASRVVFFDAVGTLIRSAPSVVETYQAAAQRVGQTIERSQIESRFRAALKVESTAAQTSEAAERAKWRRIVAATLPQCQPIDAVFEDLWRRFGTADQWRMFDDAATCLASLGDDGIVFGIASNFDQRLANVCQGLPPLKRAAYVYHSALLGWSKPSPNFYRGVEAAAGLTPNQCLMVGDDPTNDFDAARDAGWSAVLLDRSSSERVTECTINSLAALPDWLEAS